jgi:dethiobiotin synthetase
MRFANLPRCQNRNLNMKPSSLFITGTDTGVGKTVVTALLALHLRSRGIDAGVMKPLASGCETVNGELVSEDALFLKEMTGVEDELELINPLRWEEPLAPLVAARRAENAQLDWLTPFWESYKVLCSRHECVLVEGVGGLLVPLPHPQQSTFYTCADFANELQLPMVLVARRVLGTINHTALTARYPLQAPAHFAGLVFCDAQPIEENDVAANTSPDLIAEMTGLPIWGQVPRLTDLSRAAMQEAAAKIFATAALSSSN